MDIPPPLKPGDRVTAEWINTLRDFCIANRVTISPSSGLVGHTGPNGVVIGGTAKNQKILAVFPAITGAGGITAAVGATPGSGTVTLYSFSGTGAATAGSTATCYSWFTSVVGSGTKHVMVGQDTNGRYWVLSEDC